MSKINVAASVRSYIDNIYKDQPEWMRDRAHHLIEEVLASLNVSKRLVDSSEADVKGRATTITIWTSYAHHGLTVTLELFHGNDNFSVKGKVKAFVVGVL